MPTCVTIIIICKSRKSARGHTAVMLALHPFSSILEYGAVHELFAEQNQLRMRYNANAATTLAVTVVEVWSADPAETERGQLWRID